jgi:hypothetical protein
MKKPKKASRRARELINRLVLCVIEAQHIDDQDLAERSSTERACDEAEAKLLTYIASLEGKKTPR